MSAKPLVIRELSKSYRTGQPVLDGISLAVDKGDAMALVGVNGAGKTTLIKSILDFISVDHGSIEIFAKSHRHYQARRALAFLPERFQPPHYLTGRGFLRMMARLYRVGYSEKVIANTMQALDLPAAVLSRPVKEYSKGMAQKLGLIACLHSQRSLLIMDEPMSGLDPRSRHAFKKLLQELPQQDRTLFFSTHLLADVSAICNRLAILHDGMIRFIGSPDDCCRQYGTDDLEAAYMACIQSETA